uniref:Nucleocapsid protein n=1 Tax=Hemipteran orthomyxo-related virus OKIAV191 TaxID=2746272 RepID=A0A7D7EYL8_9ORTO|nr:nucleocapsid protein [Hemipteran orthomyxo-related virus OKIAV191]
MEVVRTSKRKRISAEGSDYQGPKRQRIVLNKELRSKVLKAILYAHIRVCKELGDTQMNHINLSENVSAALLNAHNCLRQATNGKGSLSSKVGTTTFCYIDPTNIVRECSINKDRMEEILKSCLNVFGLRYTPQAEWIGIASPMFAFIVGFKARRQELRIGNSDLPVSKGGTGATTITNTIPISEFGLTQAHNVLLEGITYAPNLKSMMAQSLGPMTALIMLARNSNGVYANKWEEAVLRDFMNIPEIGACIGVVKTSPVSQLRPLFRTLADILLITGSRAANRMFFPGFCLVRTLLNEGTINSVYDASETAGVLGTVLDTSSTDWIESLSFSGFKGFELYQKMARITWKMDRPLTCTNADMAKQVFFHAVFGTYKEDLGILKWMTESEPTFYNRKQLSPFFGKHDSGFVNFSPYALKRWSKLASAQQTDFLGTSSSQIIADSTLGGKRSRNWGDDFFKHLDSDATTGAFTGNRNLTGLLGQYTALLSKLRNQLDRRGRCAVVGTVDWYRFELNEDGTHVKDPEIPVESGSYFIDNRD